MTTNRVLIIDDDPSILEILEEAFFYEGFAVKAVEGTDDVFSLVEDFKPDIIILDYILKGINGGELCHQIKNNSHTTYLPVIMLSAYPKVLQSLGNYGCDHFLAKPFNLYDLVDHVSGLVMGSAG